MAGNANSGNPRGGKSITEMIQRAAKRAIKQGDSHPRLRSLDELLSDTMQSDPLAFLKAVAPYVPKEIMIDNSISIVMALDEARQRIIDLNPDLLQQNQPLTITHSATDAELIDVAQDSQGEV